MYGDVLLTDEMGIRSDEMRMNYTGPYAGKGRVPRREVSGQNAGITLTFFMS